jgi:Spy/CpxP family protein refolding chaperone
MTPHINRSLAALSVGLLVSAVPVAVSAAPVPGGGRLAQGAIEHLLEDPEVREQAQVTDEQAEQIRQQVYETRRAMIENHAQAELARLELEQLWDAETPDAEAIHAAIDRAAQIETQQKHAMADARLAIQNILTPEQRETIRGLVRERVRDHVADRRGAGGGLGERLRDRLGDRRGAGRGPGGPGGAPGGPQAGAGPFQGPDFEASPFDEAPAGPDVATAPAPEF